MESCERLLLPVRGYDSNVDAGRREGGGMKWGFGLGLARIILKRVAGMIECWERNRMRGRECKGGREVLMGNVC